MVTSASTGPQISETEPPPQPRRVTWRAVLLGLLGSISLAAVNCWVATVYSVHMVGGIQMPFGAVFCLAALIVLVHFPLRWLRRRARWLGRIAPPFSPVELMTFYVMAMFGAMVSTPGCDNSFMIIGPGLFYFATPENGWSQLFSRHVPGWFSPGWDGHTLQKSALEKLYLGGANGLADIPWSAWIPMLIAWSIFMLLTYAVLFFVALLLRRQWIENEALSFSLVELPINMVDVESDGRHPASATFWQNKSMWAGFIVVASMHVLKGLHAHFPDFPDYPINETVAKLAFKFPDAPWSAMPHFHSSIYPGAIGLAYLLNRQVSFSFWFFFFFMELQCGIGEMMGLSVQTQPRAGTMARYTFLVYQAAGGWVMMAALLLWTAREHIARLVRGAWRPSSVVTTEPFSPRFIIAGLLASIAGLLAWSSFAGINIIFAASFFGIFLITSIVLARLVVEGGFLFPQTPYYSLEWMTTGIFGAGTLGAANITKLAFLQPPILADMRTNLLPAFLHTMKIADALQMDRRQLRRLLLAAAASIVVAFAVTILVTLWALYSKGALACYPWFTIGVSNSTLTPVANFIRTKPTVDSTSVYWMFIGGAWVWLMTIARSRFLWFPFHPLGFIIAPSFPITEYWANFLIGWTIKTAVLKYGGREANDSVRPFMMGMIFGNLAGMMILMLLGFYTGVQIKFWTG